MVARLIALFCTVVITFSVSGARAGNPSPVEGNKILTRLISVNFKNTTINRALQVIEEKAYFRFSYNSDLIEGQKQVTLQAENKPVSFVLDEIFQGSIRYKEAGNHLILLKNDPEPAEHLKSKEDYYFTGKITDALTGMPISGASIYDVEAKQASISDQYGNYHLTLSQDEIMHGFYFSKKGYFDTTLVVRADVSLQNNMALYPLTDLSSVDKIPVGNVEPISTHIEERPIGKLIIPEEDFVNSENLQAIEETRSAQISLLPSIGIGSNLSTNGLFVNHFSLNVLAGYSKGVQGCEIGGIVNANKNNVTGLQIGGIGNMVGGEVYGVQIGGISNIVLHDVTGIQIGGINNLVRGRANGIQVGGISNMIAGGFRGIQVAGINNFARTNSTGLQIAGINNVVADTLYGGQISGIGNWARRGVNRCQIAGITNFAFHNQGIQLSGIYNYSRTNNGFQVGLVNSSIDGKGVALGLITFCKEGYRATEFSSNEVTNINVSFKTGVNLLYNIYTLSINIPDRRVISVGLGLGTKLNLGKRISLSTDFTTHLVQLDNFDDFQGNELHRVNMTLDVRLNKWLTLYLGPNFNVGISRYKNAEGIFENFAGYAPFYTESLNSAQLQMWCGGSAGLRIGKSR